MEKVWLELASQDPTMIEPFENFLSEVVLQMQHSNQDKHKLQHHIKKLAHWSVLLRCLDL